MNWSRSEVIAALAVAVGAVGAAAQILTISNDRLRRFLLLVLALCIVVAVRLIIAEGPRPASETASPQTAGGNPSQQSSPPEPPTQAPAPKTGSDEPPPQPAFQSPHAPVVPPNTTESAQNRQLAPPPPRQAPPPPDTRIFVPGAAPRGAESIQKAIVGDWASDHWYIHDIHFTEDGAFSTERLAGAPGGLPVTALMTGTYKFISDTRIEIRFRGFFSDEVSEWDVSISGDELSVSVVSGFSRDSTYHRKS